MQRCGRSVEVCYTRPAFTGYQDSGGNIPRRKGELHVRIESPRADVTQRKRGAATDARRYTLRGQVCKQFQTALAQSLLARQLIPDNRLVERIYAAGMNALSVQERAAFSFREKAFRAQRVVHDADQGLPALREREG